MAADEGMMEVLRDDLAALGLKAADERKMFGGICLMTAGNMIGGVSGSQTMLRVGKAREAEARALPGVTEMTFTGRPMGGFVELTDEAFADDDIRRRLLGFALAHAQSLPAK